MKSDNVRIICLVSGTLSIREDVGRQRQEKKGYGILASYLTKSTAASADRTKRCSNKLCGIGKISRVLNLSNVIQMSTLITLCSPKDLVGKTFLHVNKNK